jgi:hypothetical protein
MAETPVPWTILTLVHARLRIVRRANDYRTDAGRDVRLEPAAFDPNDSARLTLYPLTSILPDDAQSPGERGFNFVVEALVPVRLDNAQQRIVDTIADIEDALDGYTQAPLALPLQFQESVLLDRPDGIAAMAAQVLFGTRYRRVASALDYEK